MQVRLGWNTLCLFVLGRVWPTLLLTVMAALVSLVGVGFALSLARQKPEWAAGLTALAVATTGLSWLLLHTEYTLHSARRSHQDGGGILKDPDHRDFLYLGLTTGMTSQVSDTNINSRQMRRLLLQHAVLSYMFGTVIVALTVGGVANLLG